MISILNISNIETTNFAALTTLIVGFIAFIGTLWVSYYKTKAEIQAKPRIEWIQEVRKLSADYITNIYDYLTLLEKIYIYNNKDLKETARLKLLELTKNKNLLKMYYGEKSTIKYFLISRVFTHEVKNTKNIEMNHLIEKLFADLTNLEEKHVNKTYTVSDLEEIKPMEFINSCQDYFKTEWDKAKNNE